MLCREGADGLVTCLFVGVRLWFMRLIIAALTTTPSPLLRSPQQLPPAEAHAVLNRSVQGKKKKTPIPQSSRARTLAGGAKFDRPIRGSLPCLVFL